MEHDFLIGLGLDDDGAIARIARFPTLLDAWEGCEEPSDLIWIAGRLCRGAGPQLIGIVSMTLAGNIISPEQETLRKIQRQTYACLEDPGDNIVENIIVAMNAVLIEGEKKGLEVVGEGENSQIVFDGRHHVHMFMWQSLRAVSLLYVQECEQAATQLQIGWKFIPEALKPNVVQYLRKGLNVADWFADWVKESAVGIG